MADQGQRNRRLYRIKKERFDSLSSRLSECERKYQEFGLHYFSVPYCIRGCADQYAMGWCNANFLRLPADHIVVDVHIRASRWSREDAERCFDERTSWYSDDADDKLTIMKDAVDAMEPVIDRLGVAVRIYSDCHVRLYGARANQQVPVTRKVDPILNSEMHTWFETIPAVVSARESGMCAGPDVWEMVTNSPTEVPSIPKPPATPKLKFKDLPDDQAGASFEGSRRFFD